MSLLFLRSFHSKRVPNYNGWWTQILSSTVEPHSTIKIEQVPKRVPIDIPFEVQEEPTLVPTPKITVYLNNTPIELPQKPEAPDNCCMSGCAHCVWDMYGEDMAEFTAIKSDIRNRFKAQGIPLPKELEPGNDKAEEMDPSMKAFLDMEKKLNNM